MTDDRTLDVDYDPDTEQGLLLYARRLYRANLVSFVTLCLVLGWTPKRVTRLIVKDKGK